MDMETTWDGKPIASEPPYGAMVLVYRMNGEQPEFLILHRAQLGPDFEGDWAWTPPSGARQPGETIEECARRELWEEAGLRVDARPLTSAAAQDAVEDWAVFHAPVAVNVQVTLHDAEHDRYNRYKWVSPAELLARCRPDVVREGIQRALRALGFMPKPGAAVVLVSDEGVALIKRVNDRGEYYVFPGGSVEDGEMLAEAAAREARGELGVEVEIGRLLAVVEYRGRMQHFFAATPVGGEFGTGQGPEFSLPADSWRGRYAPMWIPVERLRQLNVRPAWLVELLEQGIDRVSEPLRFVEEP